MQIAVAWGGGEVRGVQTGATGAKHCFLLRMYGFYSSDALYSASISFRIFIFILNPFDT